MIRSAAVPLLQTEVLSAAQTPPQGVFWLRLKAHNPIPRCTVVIRRTALLKGEEKET